MSKDSIKQKIADIQDLLTIIYDRVDKASQYDTLSSLGACSYSINLLVKKLELDLLSTKKEE
jgi:hypothetical protein